jgi:hypothetical protein
MPGYPAVSRRADVRFCPGEGQLERATNNSIGFSIDLHIAREAVAHQNSSPKQGAEFMEAQGSLSGLQKSQLLLCLSTIAAGECVSYPKK